jgi:transcriptional regulator with XRE-family HTH domain
MKETHPILNCDRLRRYRLQAGLSERALARATAMTSMSITALEDGRNHTELSLSHLVRIARALDVDPTALFEPPPAPEPQADDILIEAALANNETWVRVEQLARGLAWTLDRTADALDQLRRRLEHTGQRIATRHGKVRLVPAAGILTDEQERDIEAAALHERGLNLALAQVLRQAVAHQINARWQRAANNNQLLAQASLLKLGFAEFDKDRLEPTQDVRYGLDPITPRRPTARSRSTRR